MSNNEINVNTFKKLLNVKKGGAEFFRLIIKISVWIFILGALFYGLIYIPNKIYTIKYQEFQTEIIKAQIEQAKISRQCQMISDNEVKRIQQTQKDKTTSKEEQKQMFIQFYNNCVYYQGMDFLQINNQTKQQSNISNNKKSQKK